MNTGRPNIHAFYFDKSLLLDSVNFINSAQNPPARIFSQTPYRCLCRRFAATTLFSNKNPFNAILETCFFSPSLKNRLT